MRSFPMEHLSTEVVAVVRHRYRIMTTLELGFGTGDRVS